MDKMRAMFLPYNYEVCGYDDFSIATTIGEANTNVMNHLSTLVSDMMEKSWLFKGDENKTIVISTNQRGEITIDMRDTPVVYAAPCLPQTPMIKNVIFNPPATIVFWEDGSKTVVKAENEAFDWEKGLAMAMVKKYFGNNKGRYYNEFRKFAENGEEAEAQDCYDRAEKIAQSLTQSLMRGNYKQ